MGGTAQAVPPRVALTGGIACGKSTVCEIFAALGVPVIDTDEIARDLTRGGAPALARIRDTLGADLVNAEGELDRPLLRERVFADPALRRRLEGLLHPMIMEEAARRAAAAGGLYQLVVVPLLFEAGLERDFDRVLVVDCPEGEQRRRLQARDGESAESVQRILAAQTSREARLQRADDVVTNDGTRAQLAEQVSTLHVKYVQWARGRKK
jgi:dephospho-CoA kinase